MVRVVCSYGPSCLNIRADLSSLTGRLVSIRVVRGPSCLVPATARLWAMWGKALPKIPKQLSVIFLSKFIFTYVIGTGSSCFWYVPAYYKLISLRLGFRRNFLSVLHPNLVSSPIKSILEIFNLTTRAFRWIFWHGRIVSDEVQVRFHK